jgi:hypothetical protein
LHFCQFSTQYFKNTQFPHLELGKHPLDRPGFSALFIWLNALVSFLMLVAANGMVQLYASISVQGLNSRNTDEIEQMKKISVGLFSVWIIILLLHLMVGSYWHRVVSSFVALLASYGVALQQGIMGINSAGASKRTDARVNIDASGVNQVNSRDAEINSHAVIDGEAPSSFVTALSSVADTGVHANVNPMMQKHSSSDGENPSTTGTVGRVGSGFPSGCAEEVVATSGGAPCAASKESLQQQQPRGGPTVRPTRHTRQGTEAKHFRESVSKDDSFRLRSSEYGVPVAEVRKLVPPQEFNKRRFTLKIIAAVMHLSTIRFSLRSENFIAVNAVVAVVPQLFEVLLEAYDLYVRMLSVRQELRLNSQDVQNLSTL